MRVAREQKCPGADEVGGGVVARDYKMQAVAEELFVRECAAVDFCVQQHADEVVARLAPARREQWLEHRVDLVVGRGGLSWFARDRHLRQHMAAPMLLAGQTDQVADHRARNRRRELLDDVERFASAAVLQQIAGEVPHVCLERADTTRTEARRQQVPPQIVLGWALLVRLRRNGSAASPRAELALILRD